MIRPVSPEPFDIHDVDGVDRRHEAYSGFVPAIVAVNSPQIDSRFFLSCHEPVDLGITSPGVVNLRWGNVWHWRSIIDLSRRHEIDVVWRRTSLVVGDGEKRVAHASVHDRTSVQYTRPDRCSSSQVRGIQYPRRWKLSL